MNGLDLLLSYSPTSEAVHQVEYISRYMNGWWDCSLRMFRTSLSDVTSLERSPQRRGTVIL